MVFGRNFCEKRKIGASEPYFRKVRGDARPWLVACWKARGRLSIRVNGTFFAVYYGSGVMSRNVYSSAVFTGGRFLSTQILPGQLGSSPINRF